MIILNNDSYYNREENLRIKFWDQYNKIRQQNVPKYRLEHIIPNTNYEINCVWSVYVHDTRNFVNIVFSRPAQCE